MSSLSRSCLPLALLLLAACSRPAPETASTPPATPASSAPAAAASQDSGPAAIAAAAPDDKKCTNEPRTDENDKRPRCGGMGAPQVAPSHAYRIALDNGESFDACDITKPFSGKIGRGLITMQFTPADDRSGKVDWHFAGGGGRVDTAYDYTLSGPEDRMTGTFHASAAVCGRAAGLGGCAAARTQTFTSTWTRIDACKQ